MADGTNPVLVEGFRGAFVEAEHRGAFAVCAPSGAVVEAAGDVRKLILPRSSVKLLQALALVESGAADAARLGPSQLALACASHRGSRRHAEAVGEWLAALGLGERDLMCGPQPPDDDDTRRALRDAGAASDQTHNTCSGKHAGFLTLAKHLGAPKAGYIDVEHRVQRMVAEAFADVTGAEAPLRWEIDGCSAPNFAASIAAIARACAGVADPETAFGSGARASAARRLRAAMATHPFEVSGAGGSCTDLITAAAGRAVVKTGAAGCYTGVLIDRGLGFALKIDDGDAAAASCAAAALLARYGAVETGDPRVARWLTPDYANRRGTRVGGMRPTVRITGR